MPRQPTQKMVQLQLQITSNFKNLPKYPNNAAIAFTPICFYSNVLILIIISPVSLIFQVSPNIKDEGC